jgi:hypothetical protein
MSSGGVVKYVGILTDICSWCELPCERDRYLLEQFVETSSCEPRMLNNRSSRLLRVPGVRDLFQLLVNTV